MLIFVHSGLYTFFNLVPVLVFMWKTGIRWEPALGGKLKKVFKIIGLDDRGVQAKSLLLGTILVVHSVLIPILPLPVKILLDRFQDEEKALISLEWLNEGLASLSEFDLLICSAVSITLLGITLAFLRYIEGIIASKINRQIFVTLRQKLNKSIFSGSLSHLNQLRKMDLVGRVSTDVEKIQQIYSGGFSTIFRAVPTIIWTVFMILWVDPLIGGILLLVIPIFYIGIYFMNVKLKGFNRQLRGTENAFQEMLLDTFSHFPSLKSLRGESSALKRIEDSNASVMGSYMGAEKVASTLYGSLILIKALVRSLILIVGFYFVQQGRITLGDFFLFFSYFESLIYPVDEISRFGSRWTKTLVAAERIESLLGDLDLHREPQGPKLSKIASFSRFEFKDVDFRYLQTEPLVLKGLSFELEGPGLVGLIGASGGGKSTIMGLMNRLYKPSRGQIFFSGVEISDIDLADLRKNVVLINQDNFLFKGSVRENLCIGNQQFSDKQMFKALDAVNALDFIKKLPMGLDTEIGEAGKGLSGGQSRRICIARAFLQIDAQVILFDEPTSGLDELSAKKVMKSLRELSSTRTVIFSTHRLKELEYVDRVLSFNHGALQVNDHIGEQDFRQTDSGSFVKPLQV